MPGIAKRIAQLCRVHGHSAQGWVQTANGLQHPAFGGLSGHLHVLQYRGGTLEVVRLLQTGGGSPRLKVDDT